MSKIKMLYLAIVSYIEVYKVLKIQKYQLLVSVDKELIDRVKQAQDILKAKNCNRVVNDILRRGLDALLGNTKKQEILALEKKIDELDDKLERKLVEKVN